MFLVLSFQKKEEKQDLVAMQYAVEAVRNKEMGFLKATKIFKVFRSNLENYVNHKTKQRRVHLNLSHSCRNNGVVGICLIYELCLCSAFPRLSYVIIYKQPVRKYLGK